MIDRSVLFPTGSFVLLRSGGPIMTVEDMRRDDGLICVQWFNGSELLRDAFDPENLVRV